MSLIFGENQMLSLIFSKNLLYFSHSPCLKINFEHCLLTKARRKVVTSLSEKGTSLGALLALALFLSGVSDCWGTQPARGAAFSSFVRVSGHVVKTIDGDSFHILTSDSLLLKVRLYGVDAPEKDQPYGTEATDFASTQLQNNSVLLQIRDRDRYGRWVADVFILPHGSGGDTLNLAYAMLEKGMAWWYKKYAADETGMQRLFEQARRNKVGLWGQTNPLAPWDHRRRR